MLGASIGAVNSAWVMRQDTGIRTLPILGNTAANIAKFSFVFGSPRMEFTNIHALSHIYTHGNSPYHPLSLILSLSLSLSLIFLDLSLITLGAVAATHTATKAVVSNVYAFSVMLHPFFRHTFPSEPPSNHSLFSVLPCLL